MRTKALSEDQRPTQTYVAISMPSSSHCHVTLHTDFFPTSQEDGPQGLSRTL